MAQTGSKTARIDGSEDRRERALSMKIIGYGVILCAALVLFFLPASIKISHSPAFLGIVAVLALVGLALVILGSMKAKS